ncbi:MAG: hypothetical protein ACP5NM_11420 [Thiomonas sp.]
MKSFVNQLVAYLRLFFDGPIPLAALHDTLPPKLICGKLCVRDAEAFLKERAL